MPKTPRLQQSRNLAARSVPLLVRRFWLICLFFFLWACAIAFKLVWLQLIQHNQYTEMAEKQQQKAFDVNPRRGVLYDRNLHELAMTVQVDSVSIDPSDLADKHAAALKLADVVHTDPDDPQTSAEMIEARLNAGHSFAWVARHVTPQVAAAIRAMSKDPVVKGVRLEKEFARFYPDNQMAAQVLGYVGLDDNGLGGVEQKYEELLHGVPGRQVAAMDAHRHVLGSKLEREPEPGRNLVLTLDTNIQFMAERALDHAMEKSNAASGTVVVQDVHTGQILGLAVRPTFNPNQLRKMSPEQLRDHAVSDVYEPGSTFKLLTYSAALDQHVARPNDPIDCQGGAITMPGGRVIHDDKGDHFGVITVHEALEHSSDVAAIKLAMKIGPDRFYQYIRDFGFGARSGVELPGETRGLLRPVKQWNISSIGSIAMGQEVAVTPVQLVTMVSTIANGGVYLPPHILMPGQLETNPKQPAAQPFKAGAELPNPLPEGSRRVLSTLTAAEMREMMRGVVLNGTGRQARLNGYSSGGKTGTAQKIDPATHRYSQTMHVASFAGIAPINNPVIAVAVVIDNPKGDYHGASVSAPIFKEVAQQVLEYLGVQHDEPVHIERPATKQDVATEDEGSGHTGDISALYAAANDLPADDPQRGGNELSKAQPQQAATVQATNAASKAAPPLAKLTPAQSTTRSTMTVVQLPAGKPVSVPNLIGLDMRRAIEQSAIAGLEVQVTGTGRVRQQLPPPGSSAPKGSKIVVQCGH